MCSIRRELQCDEYDQLGMWRGGVRPSVVHMHQERRSKLGGSLKENRIVHQLQLWRDRDGRFV